MPVTRGQLYYGQISKADKKGHKYLVLTNPDARNEVYVVNFTDCANTPLNGAGGAGSGVHIESPTRSFGIISKESRVEWGEAIPIPVGEVAQLTLQRESLRPHEVDAFMGRAFQSDGLAPELLYDLYQRGCPSAAGAYHADITRSLRAAGYPV